MQRQRALCCRVAQFRDRHCALRPGPDALADCNDRRNADKNAIAHCHGDPGAHRHSDKVAYGDSYGGAHGYAPAHGHERVRGYGDGNGDGIARLTPGAGAIVAEANPLTPSRRSPPPACRGSHAAMTVPQK